MKHRITHRQTLYQGFFKMDACEIEHDRFDGSSMHIRRELFERGDAVAVLLYDPREDEVLLLEQFRVGPAVRDDHPWMMEIVAGIIDEGETAEDCAHREALEEAGYAINELKYLNTFYSSPGACSERLILYAAEVDKHMQQHAGGGLDEEHEDIRAFWVPREQALNWALSGKINSGAPMLAMLLAFGCTGTLT